MRTPRASCAYYRPVQQSCMYYYKQFQVLGIGVQPSLTRKPRWLWRPFI